MKLPVKTGPSRKDPVNGGEYRVLMDSAGAWLADVRSEHTEQIVTALNASPTEAPQRIPEGWVLVPKDMPRFSEVNFDEELFDLCRKDDYRGLYRALVRRALAAAPPSFGDQEKGNG